MKKNLLLRVICCLLVAAMACIGIVACGNDNAGTTKPPVSNNGNGGTSDPTGTDYLLQVEQEDFNEYTINILCRVDKSYEVDVDEDASDLVGKAVYARNARVEEYLNVDIVGVPVNGSWQMRTEFVETLSRSVAAYDNQFQLAATHSSYNAGLTLNNQYYNLRAQEDIQLDAPWWSASWVENATVYDKLYFITGDVSLTMWEELYAVFFNRQIALDLELPDLYQMVRDNEWTLEEFAMLADYYQDDGNDIVDTGDTFGLLINRHSMRTFVTSCGLPIAERNDDGGFDIIFMDEDGGHNIKVDTVYGKLYDLIYEQDGTFDSKLTDGDYSEMQSIFTGGGALFMTGTLQNATALRAAYMEFGILPFPMYDEDQDVYLSHSYDGLSSFAIPASAHHPDVSAKVLDAMGAESKKSVIPAYYEVVLQGRVAQDADSKEMLGIIRENLYFDFGFIYSDPLKSGSVAGPFAFFGDELRAGKASLSSGWASAGDIYEAMLVEVLDKFRSGN